MNIAVEPEPARFMPSAKLGAVRVTMFADAFSKEPKDCDLGAILEAIRGERYAVPVARLRELRAKDGAAYQLEKRKLPAFLISGTAASRTEAREHSGLLQIDFDHLNGTLDTVRAKVKDDPHVAFGFVSPSGDGLKLGLAIDGTRHAESFLAAEKYFLENYGVKIDPSVKDRLRLCFVSHDPEAWTKDAEPLPLPAPSADEAGGPPEPSPETSGSAEFAACVLPSGDVSISESARAIFRRIGPSRSLFWRGGALVELVDVDGVASLDLLKPDAFRSRAEKFGPLFAWRSGGDSGPALKRAKMSLDDAKAILAATEAREFLPPVASVLRCPVLIETDRGDVAVLGRGYHPEQGGLLITEGDAPPQVPLAEAVASLRWLVDEFAFQDEGDRSRALAAFITPALRLGGHLRGNLPLDCAEADASQSGKGYRHNLVCALYHEAAYFVTAKAGGVGSVDESFAAALVSARPFICLDNFRGRMDSQNLEAFVTCPSLFPARIPHRGEVLIDPKKFLLQMSSNGLETTRDLANRASICRIRKRPGFAYRDTLGELQSRQSYFLGCVFSVIGEWIADGKPRTVDTRHDFREWCQTLDWIVQNLLAGAPLMDGHQAAQERTSNPALSWLRAVALAVAGEGRLGVALIASELVEVCELHAIEIPGKPADEDRAKRQVGSLCKQVFRDGDSVTVDGFNVTRGVRQHPRDDGNGYTPMKTYAFSNP
jgi:hypothetical protein